MKTNPFDRVFQGSLPLPLSRLYTRAYHAKGDRDKHDHAFHLAECALKLAASAFVARYREAGNRNKKADGAIGHLALPSLGQWRDIFRDTLAFLGKRPEGDPWSRGIFERLTAKREDGSLDEIFIILAKAIDFAGRRPDRLSIHDLLDLLPVYRNAMSDAHGSIKASPEAYREGTPALLEIANILLSESLGNVLGGGRMVYSEEVKCGPSNERLVVWMELTGPTAVRRLPPEGQVVGAEILPGRLYLELPNGEFLSLHPLLYYQPGEILDQVFFLNRARGGRSGVQFLCYATGDFYLPGRDPPGDALVRDLEGLLSWVTSGEVDAHELEKLGEVSRSDALAAGERAEEGEARPGRLFGDFEILEELGRGGMAVVYQARQLSLDRIVALKVLPPALREDPVAVARFRQEVRALSRCDHPNVVKVFSSGEAEGTHYYAMEFIDGASLASIGRELARYRSEGAGALQERHFEQAASSSRQDGVAPPSRTDPGRREKPPQLQHGRDIAFRLAAVVRDAALGVQHLHDHGIVHRDLKPQNIMLTRDRLQPVVMDLGLAKVSGISQSLTRDKGRILGTLRYMAPEQLQRNLLEVDGRADVYALGSVLYELVCGRPPFDGETEERLTTQILFEQPPPPQKVNPKIPKDLAIIISKAIQKDPRERYLTAAELASDLDRFVNGEAIHARPPSFYYLLRLFVKRNRAVLTAIALATLLLTAAFLAGEWLLAERRSRGLLEEAQRQWNRHLELSDQLGILEQNYMKALEQHKSWEPVWERQDEIDLWYEYFDAQAKLEACSQEAVIALRKAMEVAPPGSSERSRAQKALADMGRSQKTKGKLSRSYQSTLEASVSTAGPMDGSDSVTLKSDPPGAEVFCFRYKKYEERFLPLPFDPKRGSTSTTAGFLGDPFLEVEDIVEPGRTPFQAGDRLLQVRGRPVSLLGDLARSLKDQPADEAVEVKVLRAGKEFSFSWVPFPKERYGDDTLPLTPGRLIDARKQFGFDFAGYPLDFVDAARVGIAGEPPLVLRLPQGSYLLVLRKPGYAIARFPVAVPWGGEPETVRLLKESEIPDGFVYVPAGFFSCGGDPEAFQSLEAASIRIEGFLMKRLEVTAREYLEFVNDPEVFARTDPKGFTGKPAADWESEPLKKIRPKSTTIQLIPQDMESGLLFERDEGGRKWILRPRWNERDKFPEGDWPIYGIPMLAGVEYAHWLTEKSGRRWRYRLPTDLEWEKAARGADLRTYVWGKYPIWSFCRSMKGTYQRYSRPRAVGSYPADESVFAVRDMIGSVSEPTTDRTLNFYNFISYRGGNWWVIDDFFFRIATRNGRLPEGRLGIDLGIRLVADLPPAGDR